MLCRPGSLLTRISYIEAAALSVQPVAYWNLDEESGTRADSIGSLDLTDNNTVLSDDGVGAGQTAAAFVAANSEYLSHADNAILRIGDRDWTMAGWVYADSLASTARIVTKGGVGAGGEYDAFLVTTGFGFRVRNAADSASASATALFSAAAETWYFLEFGYDATANQLFARVDNGAASTGALTGGSNVAASALDFGRQSSSYLDGRLSAFGIWHGLLTDDDREYLYQSGTAARLASGGSV